MANTMAKKTNFSNQSLTKWKLLSEEEYDNIVAQIEEIITSQEELTDREHTLLKMLLALVEFYEKVKTEKLHQEWFQGKPEMAPEEVLRTLMKLKGVKQKDLLPFFGGHSGNVSYVVNGKRNISKEQAQQLGDFFQVSPSLFILGWKS